MYYWNMENIVYAFASVGLGIAAVCYAVKTRVLKKATLWESFIFLKDYAKFNLRNYVVDVFETGKVNLSSRAMIISYFRGDNKYSIVVPTIRGIKPVKNITLKSIYEGISSDDDEEVMSKIMEYAGPSRDFHGIPITPSQLGVNQPLVVTYSNNVVKEYGPDNIIVVTLPV